MKIIIRQLDAESEQELEVDRVWQNKELISFKLTNGHIRHYPMRNIWWLEAKP